MEDDVFESPLMISIASQSEQIALFLIKHGKNIVVTKCCRNLQYKGATALHLAIMNQSQTVITAMLDLMENPTERMSFILLRATGRIFQDMNVSGLTPFLALECGYLNIYFDLINSGIDMDIQDRGTGHTALHILVNLGKRNPQNARHLLDQYFKHRSAKAWYCRKFKVSPFEYTIQDDYIMKRHLLKIENTDGFTPLTYAAKEGDTDILYELLQCEGVYKHTLWKFGPTCYVTYDMAEVDPQVASIVRPGKPSVLELLAYHVSDDNLQSLSLEPIKQLTKRKWICYVPLFFTWIVLHLGFMCYNNNHVLQFVAEQKHHIKSIQWNTTIGEDNINMLKSPGFWVLITITSIYSLFPICGVLKSLRLLVLGRLFRKNGKHYKVPWKIIFCFNEYDFFMVIFCISTFAFALTYFTANYTHFVTLLSCSLFFGWLLCLIFARSFEATSHFILMVKTILLTDMLWFALVTLIFLVSFGIVLLLLFAQYPDVQETDGIIQTMNTLFALAIGMGNIDFIKEASEDMKGLMEGLIYCFLILSLVLMLNVLIAAMSDTYMQTSENKRNKFQRIRMEDVLALERKFPTAIIKLFYINRFLCYDEHRQTWVLPVR